MTDVVSVSNLTVVRDRRSVLSVGELHIKRDERWVILGPNGSGKTTLLSVLSGRLWPTSGEVQLLGHELGHVDLRTLRGRLGLVSASVSKQLRDAISVHDVVVTGTDGALEPWWRTYDDTTHARADRLLDEMGVGSLSSRSFGVISEGEKAHVLLARTLIADPELLCLDEPAAGLDLGARERLLHRLARLASSEHTAPIVMVTHHLEEIPMGFTHAALLRDGSLWRAGSVESVVTSKNVSEAFGIFVEVTRHVGGRYSARGTDQRSWSDDRQGV